MSNKGFEVGQLAFCGLRGAAVAPGDVGTYHAGVEISFLLFESLLIQYGIFYRFEVDRFTRLFAYPVLVPDFIDDAGYSCAVTFYERPLRPFGLCVGAGLAIAPHHPDDATPEPFLAYVQLSLPLLGQMVPIVVRCNFP